MGRKHKKQKSRIKDYTKFLYEGILNYDKQSNSTEETVLIHFEDCPIKCISEDEG